MLDYDSEDIDGMDDNAGEEQAQKPPLTGRWTATSSYDVYMVDTPKKASDDDNEDPVANKTSETQSKRRRPKRRSKPRRSKDGNTGTRENSTPDDTENNEDPVGATSEQEEQDNGQVNPDKQAMPNDPDDDSYRPLSEDEESLGSGDFIVPKAPLEQERFKRQLIATARSLKKKKQQLQANQDLLIDRWTDVLAAEEYGLKCLAKSYSKRRLLPRFDEEAPEPIPPSRNAERPPRGRNSAAD